jgi:exosome complex component CSL4
MLQEPPTLRFALGATVAPGDRLGTIRQASPGSGCYVRGGHIYASQVGSLSITSSTRGAGDEDPSSPPSCVCNVDLDHDGKLAATAQVLAVGQLVLGRVVRVTPQNAVVEICVAEGVGALQSPHEGAIRKEDVRSGATEQVELTDCFQPGDLVVSRVLSLGDSRRYFLTTAEAELGVIRAMSPNNKDVPMVPISWKEMQCPETGIKEPRKCAKP